MEKNNGDDDGDDDYECTSNEKKQIHFTFPTLLKQSVLSVYMLSPQMLLF